MTTGKVKKIFVICPRVRTGGPEAQHQLVDYLNRLGVDAYVVYHPNPDRDYSLLYPEFTNVKVSDYAYDDPAHLVIVPEIYTIPESHQEFPTSPIAVYWLSYVNAVIERTAATNLKYAADAIHLFNSYNAYAMIRPHLWYQDTPWLFLTDHIHDDFLALEPADFLDGKEDLVCFNAVKDKISGPVCETAGIPYVPIIGMSRDEVMATLRRCKVYVDNGFHPGKERMPREAAMHGCVVITNKSGSAAYYEDVPIAEKVTLETEIPDLIADVLADYRAYFDKQAHYRAMIRSEKECFEINARNFVEEIERIVAAGGGRERLAP